MNPPQRLARIAGVLYLLVAVLTGSAELYVRASVYVPGDAAATARNVVAHATLVRVGFVADLAGAVCFLFVGLALYLLLRHVHENVARVMVVFVAISVAIGCLNLLPHFAALRVATDGAYAAALGSAGSDALVLLLLDTQHYGVLINQVFFGLWLLPLGYLVYRSGMFPRWLGVLLAAGCFGYLVDLFARFLVPDVGAAVGPFAVVVSAVGELAMVGWLLVRGVRVHVGGRALAVSDT